jgi:hypothetical protein
MTCSGNVLAKFVKKPGERKRYTVDYSEWLDEGETVTGATFAITPVTSPILEVDASSIGTPATTVVFFVNGGVAGSDYELKIHVTTSGGQVKEDTALFSVR